LKISEGVYSGCCRPEAEILDDFELEREFFSKLEQLDAEIAQKVANARCPRCGGPLHQSNYERKPRGGLLAAIGEESVTRFSFCCGNEGCRKRATPPSVRFLGRRFYLGVVVFLGSIIAQAQAKAAEIRRRTGVPARTTRRWLGWWRGPFLSTEVFVWLRAQRVGIAEAEQPTALANALSGSWASRITTILKWVAPLTTTSLADGARFLGDCA
jgi:hypothetical protein